MLKPCIQTSLLVAVTALLMACGGGGGNGGGNNNSSSEPASLSGVAAIGAAMVNATVTLKDSNGQTATAKADANGNFSFRNISGFTPPVMLRAEGVVQGKTYKLHSLLTSLPNSGNINLNVTPATEALTAQTLGTSPVSVFDRANFKNADPVALQKAKDKLVAALHDTLLALGMDTTAVDFMTSKFAADQTGLDKLLDLVGFTPDAVGNIKLNDKNEASKPSVTISSNDTLDHVSTISVKVDGNATLDTTGIKSLINKLINNSTTITDADVASDFLFQGNNKTQFMSQLSPSNSNTSTFKVDTNFKIKKCIQASKICYVGLQIKTPSSDAVLKVVDMGVKQDSGGKWTLYGDQAPFVFSYTPLFTYIEKINSAGTTIATVPINGVALDFPGDMCSGCTTTSYQTINVTVSFDGGRSYSSSQFFNAAHDTYVTGNVLNTDNILILNNADAKKFNDANQTGKLKLRITPYPIYGTAKTWEPDTFPMLFTSETEVKGFMAQNSMKITSGLGTQSVSYSGSKILQLIVAFTNRIYSNLNFVTTYDTSAFPTNTITPLDNINACKNFGSSYGKPNLSCSDFLRNSNINGAGFIFTDDKGRLLFYMKYL